MYVNPSVQVQFVGLFGSKHRMLHRCNDTNAFTLVLSEVGFDVESFHGYVRSLVIPLALGALQYIAAKSLYKEAGDGKRYSH